MTSHIHLDRLILDLGDIGYIPASAEGYVIRSELEKNETPIIQNVHAHIGKHRVDVTKILSRAAVTDIEEKLLGAHHREQADPRGGDDDFPRAG